MIENDESATNPEPAVYTAKEARKMLRLSHGAFYAALHSGEVPSVKIGKRYLIPARSLRALLDKAAK